MYKTHQLLSYKEQMAAIDQQISYPSEIRECLRDANEMQYINNAQLAIDCCELPCPPIPCELDSLTALAPKKKNQEKNMNLYNDDECICTPTLSENERKISYFQGELCNASYVKRDALTEQYKLNLQDKPLSPKEFVEWIKDGKFTFTKSKLNDDGSWREPECYHSFYEPTNFIHWNNPDRDVTGFQAAQKVLDTATRTAERAITAASTPAEMLKVLQDFESTSIN